MDLIPASSKCVTVSGQSGLFGESCEVIALTVDLLSELKDLATPSWLLAHKSSFWSLAWEWTCVPNLVNLKHKKAEFPEGKGRRWGMILMKSKSFADRSFIIFFSFLYIIWVMKLLQVHQSIEQIVKSLRSLNTFYEMLTWPACQCFSSCFYFPR